jgi:DNA ligase-1
MNSIEALEVLKKAGEANSQNLKADILRLHISDPLLRKIFAAALDSFVTYGVTIASSVSGQGSANFDHLDAPIWNTLDRLASRHLTGAEMWRQINSLRMLYNEPSFELFKRIVNKDLRVAVTSTIVTRLLPGFIPVFDVMLAQKYEAKRIKSFPVAVEPKRDGVRVVCIANAIEQNSIRGAGNCSLPSITSAPMSWRR